MIKKKIDYHCIYGPVASWRLGVSLGIDPISMSYKVCSFDCLYCQIGRTKVLSTKRECFATTDEIIGELKTITKEGIDYITFAGAGEPTLAGNLGRIIQKVKAVRLEKVAVITNSSILNDPEVRSELLMADKVIVKLDAADEKTFKKINRPAKEVKFKNILQGLRDFRKEFKGELAVQIMVIKENKKSAKEIAKLAYSISPDEIQINTPLRPCPVEPLGKKEITAIIEEFKILCPKTRILSVYGPREEIKTESISGKDTLRRRGKLV
ncbi:MAG: radical SAM protein [Elusimicrobia bacterium]|nr:radical SAM protein [Elusimicrobiota bacterium]